MRKVAEMVELQKRDIGRGEEVEAILMPNLIKVIMDSAVSSARCLYIIHLLCFFSREIPYGRMAMNDCYV